MEKKKTQQREVKKKEYSETGFFPRMIPIELDPAEAGGGGSGAREWAIPYRWLTNKNGKKIVERFRGCAFGAVLCFIDFLVETFQLFGRRFDNCLLYGTKNYKWIDL